MKKQSTTRILIITLLLSLGLAAVEPQLLSAIHAARAPSPQIPQSVPTVVYVTPQNQTDLTKTTGNTVNVAVNVSQSPPLNAFSVILYYNSTVLQPCDGTGQNCPFVDYSGNVLGNDATSALFCIDGHRQPASVADCPGTDHVGIISLSLVINARVTGNISLGTLFQITFNVASVGLAQFHLFNATLETATSVNVAPTPVQNLKTQDGYFTNLDCPAASGRGCRPPTVRISYSPNPVVKKTPIDFNTTITENNIGAGPLACYWDFGDGGNLAQTNSTKCSNGSPVQHTFSPSGTIGGGSSGGPCVSQGVCAVSLTVYDNETISWTTTILVTILNVYIKVAVTTVAIDHDHDVIPGTIVHIRADITNLSSFAENATMTISLENQKQLDSGEFSLAGPGSLGQTKSLSSTWDTSGYLPRAYAIVMNITSVVSAIPVAGNFLRTQNDTSGNLVKSYIILISPLITGSLSLSLLQSTGLGLLVIAAIVVGMARFARKPSYEKEPL